MADGLGSASNANEFPAIGVRIDPDGAEQGERRVVRSFKNVAAGAKDMADGVGGASREMVDALKALQNIELARFFAEMVDSAKEAIGETISLAARYDELGIVLARLGKNVGANTAQIDDLQQQLQRTGISALSSRQAIVQLINANFDLANATKLARLAQDAAVIGQTNSSDAFTRLVGGIQRGETEILRTIGLNVNFQKSYKDLAAELGKTASSLTEQEKIQARTNAAFAAGANITGAYESAMGSAGKQMRSTQRYAEDLKVAIGEAFQPIYVEYVSLYGEALKSLGGFAKDSPALVSALAAVATGIGTVTAAVIAFKLASKVGVFDGLADIVKFAAKYPELAAAAAVLLTIGAAWAYVKGQAAAAKKEVDDYAASLQTLNVQQLQTQLGEFDRAIKAVDFEIASGAAARRGALKDEEETLRRLTGMYDATKQAIVNAKAAGDPNGTKSGPTTVDPKVEQARKQLVDLQRSAKDLLFAAGAPNELDQLIHKHAELVEKFAATAKTAQVGGDALAKYAATLKQVADVTRATAVTKEQGEGVRERADAEALADAQRKGAEAVRDLRDATERLTLARKLHEQGMLSETEIGQRLYDLQRKQAADRRAAAEEETTALAATNDGLRGQIALLSELGTSQEKVNAILAVERQIRDAQKIADADARERRMREIADNATLQDSLTGINRSRELVQQQADAEKAQAAARRDALTEPFKNAIEQIQKSFSDMFTRLFAGSIKSLRDFASEMKDVILRMVAEILSSRALSALGQNGLLGAIFGLPNAQSAAAAGADAWQKAHGADAFAGASTATRIGSGVVAAGAGFAVGSVAGGFTTNTTLGGLGGAAAGAATGAALGTILPGIGTAVGALVGGLAGAIGGILSSAKAHKEEEEKAKAATDALGKINSQLNTIANGGSQVADALQQVNDAYTAGLDAAKAMAKGSQETYDEAVAALAKQADAARDKIKQTAREDVEAALETARGNAAYKQRLDAEREFQERMNNIGASARDSAEALDLTIKAQETYKLQLEDIAKQEQADNERRARQQLTESMAAGQLGLSNAEREANLAGDGRGALVARVTRESAEAAADLAAQYDAGKITTEQLTYQLDLLNRETQKTIADYDKQIAQQKDLHDASIDARDAASKGLTQESEDIQRNAEFRRQLSEEEQYGAEAVAKLIRVQQQETAVIERERAEKEADARASQTARLLTAAGLNDLADSFSFFKKQEQDLRELRESGASAQTIAFEQMVQGAEAVNFQANQQYNQTVAGISARQEFGNKILDAIEKGVNDQLDVARDQLDKLDETAKASRAAADTLKDYTQSLATDASLSPEQRLAAAQAAYDAAAAKAKSGDAEAAGALPGAGRTLLDAARAMFGSGSGFQNVFAQVSGDASSLALRFDQQAKNDEALLEQAKKEVDYLEKQLKVLEEQRDINNAGAQAQIDAAQAAKEKALHDADVIVKAVQQSQSDAIKENKDALANATNSETRKLEQQRLDANLASQKQVDELVAQRNADYDAATKQINELKNTQGQIGTVGWATAQAQINELTRNRDAAYNNTTAEIFKLEQQRQENDAKAQAQIAALNQTSANTATAATNTASLTQQTVAANQAQLAAQNSILNATNGTNTTIGAFRSESNNLLGFHTGQFSTMNNNLSNLFSTAAGQTQYMSDQLSALRSIDARLAARSFAKGGDFSGGLRLVGERGPELELTGPSRIFTADQTRSLLSGAGSRETVAELRAQRGELTRIVSAVLASAREQIARLDAIEERLAGVQDETRLGRERPAGAA